jgi:hypothetical protein
MVSLYHPFALTIRPGVADNLLMKPTYLEMLLLWLWNSNETVGRTKLWRTLSP